MAKNLKIRMFTALPDSIGQANQRVTQVLDSNTAKLLIEVTRDVDQLANTGLWLDPILKKKRANELPPIGRRL